MLNKKRLTPFEQILSGNYVVLTLKFDEKTIVRNFFLCKSKVILGFGDQGLQT